MLKNVAAAQAEAGVALKTVPHRLIQPSYHFWTEGMRQRALAEDSRQWSRSCSSPGRAEVALRLSSAPRRSSDVPPSCTARSCNPVRAGSSAVSAERVRASRRGMGAWSPPWRTRGLALPRSPPRVSPPLGATIEERGRLLAPQHCALVGGSRAQHMVGMGHDGS